MIASLFARPILCVVTLTLLALGQPASAHHSDDGTFHLEGTFVITSTNGAHQVVALSGTAAPGGSFTGVATGKQSANGDVSGKVTLDFGDGDTLTYKHDLVFDPETGLIVGTYKITGGTGRFDGAKGSGRTVIDPAGDGTGEFEVDGALSL